MSWTTTINHDLRKATGLDMNEFTIADFIYYNCTNPQGKVKGWFYASKQTMADEFGLSKRSVLTIIEKLIIKGFVKKHPSTKHLKTTSKWFKAVPAIKHNLGAIAGEESSPPVKKVHQPRSVKKVHRTGEESSPLGGEESSPNTIHSNTLKDKESEQSTRTVPKKVKKNPSTLNAHSSSSSGEGSAAAGGGADSPDPAVAIKEKVLSNQQQIETWKMRYKVNGDLPELAENFADWFIAKSCEGMGDREIESWADRTGSIVFRKAFETSWLKNLKKFKTTETPSSKVLPKSKSQYV